MVSEITAGSTKNVINIYLLRGPMMGKKLTLFPTVYIPFWCPAFFVYLAEGKMHNLGFFKGKRSPWNYYFISLYKLIYYWGTGSLKYPNSSPGSLPGFCLFVPKLLLSRTYFSFLPFTPCPEQIIIDDTCFIICVTSLENCLGEKKKSNLLELITFLWTVLSQIWRCEYRDIPKTPKHII